ncbi:hypothetical protein [Desulfitobacterium sp.]|uniref:hypothetical protein n=1 Tax=Desulfitobacterium sp. TaxID=49981 RepID=UPI002B79BDD3|nr:hypothetical protein [Desulfitobacterium sp.]HVJ49394.1 hypothetical protein [Desulfitobacterium sp.]
MTIQLVSFWQNLIRSFMAIPQIDLIFNELELTELLKRIRALGLSTYHPHTIETAFLWWDTLILIFIGLIIVLWFLYRSATLKNLNDLSPIENTVEDDRNFIRRASIAFRTVQVLAALAVSQLLLGWPLLWIASILVILALACVGIGLKVALVEAKNIEL